MEHFKEYPMKSIYSDAFSLIPYHLSYTTLLLVLYSWQTLIYLRTKGFGVPLTGVPISVHLRGVANTPAPLAELLLLYENWFLPCEDSLLLGP
jgi:hypothetical protein